MARNVVVLGFQWGDEGKGKIVDALAVHFDIVARYQGGANAGHTVVVGGRKFILQLIPSGLLRPDKVAVIGNGVVIDPDSFLQELDSLTSAGVQVDNRLKVSDRAHVIMPYHRAHELAVEEARGAGKIGTTAKGIGPAYEDKAGRRGLRTTDLRNPELLRRKARELVAEKSKIAALYGCPLLDADEVVTRLCKAAERIVPYITDVSSYLNSEMDRGKSVLFEGAQGTLLDLDHGTYPFVTSSSAAAGGACTGTGVGPTRITAVVGVSKAYATRVGSGPFPTEVLGPEGAQLRERGGEYGAVTGRPRRCGWFDVPVARYSARVNGLRALIVTKLDILDPLPEIPVGVEYEYEGGTLPDFPADLDVLSRVKVRYQVMPGWQESTFGITEYERLPEKARKYLQFLAGQVGVEIAMVSTGPERDQLIWVPSSRTAALLRGTDS